MRNRHGAQRNPPHAGAHPQLCPGRNRAHPPGPVRRPELPQAHPLRRVPDYEPLELSHPADAGPPCGRPGGRQHRDHQTQRLFPRHQRVSGRSSGETLPPGICGSGHRRPGGKQLPAGAEIRLHLLHRQQNRGPAGSGKGRSPSDPRHPGAGREKPLHCRQHRQNSSGGPADCLRQIPELRSDLRGPGLHPLPRVGERSAD